MVQRGCDQLVDNLLNGRWRVVGSHHHQPSDSNWLKSRACGQHTVSFSHQLGASASAEWLKDIVMYIPQERIRILSRGCTISFPF